VAKQALQKDLARELKAVEEGQAELAREKQQVEEVKSMNEQLQHEKREELQRASEEATAFIDAEKIKLQELMHRKLQEAERVKDADMQANAEKHTRAVEVLAGELKSSKAEARELQQEAETLNCTLEAEREQSKQALSNERSEKEALLKEKMEEAAKHNEAVLDFKKMLEEKREREDVEEIRDQMHKAELEAKILKIQQGSLKMQQELCTKERAARIHADLYADLAKEAGLAHEQSLETHRATIAQLQEDLDKAQSDLASQTASGRKSQILLQGESDISRQLKHDLEAALLEAAEQEQNKCLVEQDAVALKEQLQDEVLASERLKAELRDAKHLLVALKAYKEARRLEALGASCRRI